MTRGVAGEATSRAGRRRVVAWAAGGVAALGYLAAVDPNGDAGYLPCPMLLTTGLYCPGCGGLRAVHALLHGDVALSLARHPLVIPLLLLLAVGLVRWWRRGRPPLRVDPASWRFRLVLVLTAAFWVARNLPGWSWLSPA